ncbi:hypothetical protein C8Q77DRAFT_1097199 [Trametes polyzona]|nr:hypothetical protein C8Q77DRAFT_1097199 [Trametes polyzona]
MEVDMQSTPLRATRSATKRARSPSSPGQYDRPSKRAQSSGHDMSVPIAFPAFQTSPAEHGLPTAGAVTRLRNPSQDWVSQTQSMRLESPASEQSGLNTPITDDDHGRDARGDEVMADESMPGDENTMSISPPRPSHFPSSGASSSLHLPPHNAGYPSTKGTLQPQNPNRLQIPAIQIQAATPSPVQMYSHPPLDSPALPASSSGRGSGPPFASDDATMRSPSDTSSPTGDFRGHQPGQGQKRQRFTMGPRADCELCRMRVKGHYMHFD